MNIIIADDSAVVRAILEQNLRNYPDITIVASVSNGKRLLEAAKNKKADAIISDCDMPELQGIDSLTDLSAELHIPIIILRDATFSANKSHLPFSVCFIEKPRLNSYNKAFFENLLSKIKNLIEKSADKNHSANVKSDSVSGTDGFKVLCIGASTGGPSSVSEVLKALGKDFPLPILYVQHIEIGDDKTMADWFCTVCPNIKVQLANDGEEAKAGTVYMAPADRHLIIDYVKADGSPVLKLSDEEPERFLRPAVNKLFKSASQHYGNSCLALLLTGMGMDGAEGCKQITDMGGWTIVEDKSTCAVFGMPAAAIELGGAKEILPRQEISKRVLELVK